MEMEESSGLVQNRSQIVKNRRGRLLKGIPLPDNEMRT